MLLGWSGAQNWPSYFDWGLWFWKGRGVESHFLLDNGTYEINGQTFDRLFLWCLTSQTLEPWFQNELRPQRGNCVTGSLRAWILVRLPVHVEGGMDVIPFAGGKIFRWGQPWKWPRLWFDGLMRLYLQVWRKRLRPISDLSTFRSISERWPGTRAQWFYFLWRSSRTGVCFVASGLGSSRTCFGPLIGKNLVDLLWTDPVVWTVHPVSQYVKKKTNVLNPPIYWNLWIQLAISPYWGMLADSFLNLYLFLI